VVFLLLREACRVFMFMRLSALAQGGNSIYPVAMNTANSEEGARRLKLLHPLLYIKAELPPFPQEPRELGEQEDYLFCFALDMVQSRSIEPDPATFLGPLCAAGYLAVEHPNSGTQPEDKETLELPAGSYLFAQKRKALDREAVINLTMEVQKDGLWERVQPEEHLYVRYLREEGAAVTQIFRPYRENP
jgi:hypothetical protein